MTINVINSNVVNNNGQQNSTRVEKKLENLFKADYEKSGPYKRFFKKDSVGNTYIVINDKNITQIKREAHLILNGVEFKFPIRIEKLNQLDNNSTIETIFFYGCKKINLTVDNNSLIKGLVFSNCDIEELNINSSTIGSSGIDIKNDILKYEVSVGLISIKNSKILGPFSLVNCNVNYFKAFVTDFSLNNNEHKQKKITHNISVENSQINSLELYDKISADNGFRFKSVNFDSLYINNSNYTHHINNQRLCKLGRFVFKLCEIKKMRVHETEFASFDIIECKSSDVISMSKCVIISSGEDIGFKIEQSKIHFLNILKFRFDTKISIFESGIDNGTFINCQFIGIELTGFLHSGSNLRFDSSITTQLTFIGFINLGNIYFKEINNPLESKINLFTVINTDLGKTQFLNCGFESHWRYDFQNSKILDIFILGTFLPRISGMEESYVSHSNQRNLFGQLHKVYEANGNRVRALYCNRLSLQNYLKQLKYKKNKTRREIVDLISLRINDLTNHFDFNIFRSFGVLIIFCAFSYSFYLLGLGSCPCFSSSDCYLRFLHYLVYIFHYLNPTNYNSFLPNYETGKLIPVKGFAVIWASLSKLIFAYLIYQFVQSFRKYGRGK